MSGLGFGLSMKRKEKKGKRSGLGVWALVFIIYFFSIN